MIDVCRNKCWCEYCKRAIEKEEKFLIILKQARKGTTRTNICKDCIMEMSVEFGIKNIDIKRIKKEFILKELNK